MIKEIDWPWHLKDFATFKMWYLDNLAFNPNYNTSLNKNDFITDERIMAEYELTKEYHKKITKQ